MEPLQAALPGRGTPTGNVHGKDRTGPIPCGVPRCCSRSQFRQQSAWANKMMDCLEPVFRIGNQLPCIEVYTFTLRSEGDDTEE